LRPVLFISIFGLSLSLPVLCVAQEVTKPDFTADAVVGLLVDQVDLGASRSICIGTQSECAQAKATPFDMMVTFDLDSARLLPQAETNLRVVAQALNDKRLKKATFHVKGHTDSRGAAEHNQALSDLRAKAVSNFLLGLDVDPSQVIALGMGESVPRFPDPRDPGNRRVELSLSVE
jgi:outer membrane protein OmpA-like peptidoglycan-associated protein